MLTLSRCRMESRRCAPPHVRSSRDTAQAPTSAPALRAPPGRPPAAPGGVGKGRTLVRPRRPPRSGGIAASQTPTHRESSRLAGRGLNEPDDEPDRREHRRPLRPSPTLREREGNRRRRLGQHVHHDLRRNATMRRLDGGTRSAPPSPRSGIITTRTWQPSRSGSPIGERTIRLPFPDQKASTPIRPTGCPGLRHRAIVTSS